MEFSFEIPTWMDIFLEQPILIVAWAAFGMPFLTFAFMFVSTQIVKIVKSKFLENAILVLGIVLLVTWLAGFILMIIMFFGGVHPIKLIISWFLLLITVLVFSVAEHRLVLRWINNMEEIPLVKKRKQNELNK